MPEYNFRIRFHFSGGNHINSEAEKLLVLQETGGATIRLHSGARGSAIKDHSRASLIGGPYPCAADASLAERAGDQKQFQKLRSDVLAFTAYKLGVKNPIVETNGRVEASDKLQKSLKEYQRLNNLNTTGSVDVETLRKLAHQEQELLDKRKASDARPRDNSHDR